MTVLFTIVTFSMKLNEVFVILEMLLVTDYSTSFFYNMMFKKKIYISIICLLMLVFLNIPFEISIILKIN